MNIGLAIAPERASPSAFVVFRDRLEVSFEKAARLGYDGVELALLDASELSSDRIAEALTRYGLELPVISTGRVFSEGHLWFTHADAAIRRLAVDRLKGMIELAAGLGAKVNVGRVRGFIHEGELREVAEARFLECMSEFASHAATMDVEILVEPVNRYEINYINSVTEALEVLQKLEHSNVKVMPDLFHMNIEDDSIAGSLIKAGPSIGYMHFADSNRQAPGRGHLNFPDIVRSLAAVGYDWYVTAEILPYPDPDVAAASTIRYLRQIISDGFA